MRWQRTGRKLLLAGTKAGRGLLYNTTTWNDVAACVRRDQRQPIRTTLLKMWRPKKGIASDLEQVMIFEGDKYFPVCVVWVLSRGLRTKSKQVCYHKESAFHDED